jgi:hypothetical protein
MTSLEAKLDAMMENFRLEQMEDYLRRGRWFAREDLESLKLGWRNLHKVWAADVTNKVVSRLIEDVEAEFSLRGEVPPEEQVADSREKITEGFKAVMHEVEQDPERWAALTKNIGDEFRAFVASVEEGKKRAN